MDEDSERAEKALREKELKQRRKQEQTHDGRPRDDGELLKALKREHGEKRPDLYKKRR
jgi:hypothetical protein